MAIVGGQRAGVADGLAAASVELTLLGAQSRTPDALVALSTAEESAALVLELPLLVRSQAAIPPASRRKDVENAIRRIEG